MRIRDIYYPRFHRKKTNELPWLFIRFGRSKACECRRPKLHRTRKEYKLL